MSDISPALEILFEDDFIIAINKPPCTHSVMQGSSRENSIAYSLFKRNPGACAVSFKEDDAGLVHRLDFETSGVLIAAKTRDVWIALREQFSGDKIKKTYLALVEGEFPETAVVSSRIGSRHRRGKKVRVYPESSDAPRTQPAQTSFEQVKFIPDHSCSVVRAFLTSGRRHQIRAHASETGHPLFGDSLYGSTRSVSDTVYSTRDVPSFLLHASSIVFPYPIKGELFEITAVSSLFENLLQ